MNRSAEAAVAASTEAASRVRIGPAPLVSLAVALAGALGSLAVSRGLFDPDYFWHIATARLIIQTGSIPRTDPFSFTWAGEPWVPDQWLAEVAMHGLVGWVGLAGALFAFGVVAAVAVILVAAGTHTAGATSAGVVIAAVLTAAAVMPQATLRPQVLSMVMLAVELYVLLTVSPQRLARAAVLPPLFVLWANTHGFYVIGLGVGLVYLIATLLRATPMAPRRWTVVAIGLASVVACFATPSGPAGVVYSLSFADTGDWGAQNIAEWQSPDFHDPFAWPFLLVLLAVAWRGGAGAPGWVRVTALTGCVLGLLAWRSIAPGVLLALPAVAWSIRVSSPPVRRPAVGRRWLEFGAAIIVAVVVSLVAFVRFDAGRQPSAAQFPVAGVEWLKANDPDARVLAHYGWGGYVIERLYPFGGRVFVDGRMHKYAPEVVEDYARIVDVAPGWETLVDRYLVEAMLMPADALLARGPAAAAGWCEAFRDDTQVLLRPDCPAASAYGGTTR